MERYSTQPPKSFVRMKKEHTNIVLMVSFIYLPDYLSRVKKKMSMSKKYMGPGTITINGNHQKKIRLILK